MGAGGSASGRPGHGHEDQDDPGQGGGEPAASSRDDDPQLTRRVHAALALIGARRREPLAQGLARTHEEGAEQVAAVVLVLDADELADPGVELPGEDLDPLPGVDALAGTRPG